MSYIAIEVGTKFKWVLSDDTYRVAIQTANGVLQVKSVTDGGGEVHDANCKCMPCAYYKYNPRPLKRTPFKDYSDWLKSLPKGGKTTITIHEAKNSIENRIILPQGISDFEKVEALQRNFNLRSFVLKMQSPAKSLQILLRDLQSFTYARLTSPYGPNTEEFKVLKKNAQNARRRYRKQLIFVNSCTEKQANDETYRFYQRGTGKLLVRCGGNMYNITSHDGLICRDDGKGFSTFAEMGADLAESGSPALFVKYRGRYVTV